VTTLTAAIIARDEGAHIGACLETLSFADERLVLVDAATVDATAEIARAHGARVESRPFDNFAAQRDAALALCQSDWVLFVDADERVRPALRDEIRSTIVAPGDRLGFWIPRDNVLLGRVIRHAGWAPDFQLRLLRRGSVRYDPQRPVHEEPLVDGPVGHISAPFLHLNYRTLGEFVRKQERYCRLDAQRWLLMYGRPRLRALVGQPLREFVRRYIVLRGYREGWRGLVLCVLLAFYAGKTVWLARGLT
jgi:(heptosyl)LPS beta-1,4-glucosyltransferase